MRYKIDGAGFTDRIAGQKKALKSWGMTLTLKTKRGLIT